MENRPVAQDVETVVTSYNQGKMLLEAVRSLGGQTLLPKRAIVVDDGSTDAETLRLLADMEAGPPLPVPLAVVRQPNRGVSAARNAGIGRTPSPMVLVLDGDDRLGPCYLEQVRRLLAEHDSLVAASSWIRTFGVLDAVVRPGGGRLPDFLARNACPATHVFRREAWEKSGGYDESMRSGFEDWDFFISMLEAVPGARIGIVQEPLLEYRTAPASANIKSMEKRLDLIRFLVGKHRRSYQAHVEQAVLGFEAASIARLAGWEGEMRQTMAQGRPLSAAAQNFVQNPTYGDGGMAAAVRIVSHGKNTSP